MKFNTSFAIYSRQPSESCKKGPLKKKKSCKKVEPDLLISPLQTLKSVLFLATCPTCSKETMPTNKKDQCVHKLSYNRNKHYGQKIRRNISTKSRKQ